MTPNRLDQRVRALVVEVVETSPAPPAFGELATRIAPPESPVDVEGLWRQGRRRRRQRLGLALATAVVVVAVVASTIIAVGRSGSGPQVQVGGHAGSTAHADGLSLTLPPGWRQLSRHANGGEVLVVGTMTRPPSGRLPCSYGELTGRAAYIEIFASPTPTGLPPLPSGQTEPTAPPRPAQFTLANASSPIDCVPGAAPAPSGAAGAAGTTSSGGLPNHVRGYDFTVGANTLMIEVVSVGDPTKSLLEQGVAVLNTLQVTFNGPIQIANTPSSPPTLPAPVGPPPADQAAARQAVLRAYRAVFENATGSQSNQYLQDAPILTDTELQQLQRTYGTATLRVNVTGFRFLNPTTAALIFALLRNGRQVTGVIFGEAFLNEGLWQVQRGTFCTVLGYFNVACG